MIWWLRWKYRAFREKFWVKVASLLPDRLVYHASLRLMVFACSGKWGDTEVPRLGGMDAIGRWEKGKRV